jgi:hypothetical protein
MKSKNIFPQNIPKKEYIFLLKATPPIMCFHPKVMSSFLPLQFEGKVAIQINTFYFLND